MKFSTASAAAVIAALPTFVAAVNHTVIVGANANGEPGLVFDPQVTRAVVGDIVNFQFRGGNHTVTQSSFANPCTWQLNTATNQPGFHSGFVPFDAQSGQVGVYSLSITQDTAPIWYFCGRPPHCKGGMFGAINPPTEGERTFEAFAASIPDAQEPGLGVTAPFTPPGATPPNGAPSGSAPPAGSNTDTGAPAPSGGADAPAGAMGLTARSATVIGAVGFAVSLLL